jgi:hypothetical protein
MIPPVPSHVNANPRSPPSQPRGTRKEYRHTGKRLSPWRTGARNGLLKGRSRFAPCPSPRRADQPSPPGPFSTSPLAFRRPRPRRKAPVHSTPSIPRPVVPSVPHRPRLARVTIPAPRPTSRPQLLRCDAVATDSLILLPPSLPIPAKHRLQPGIPQHRRPPAARTLSQRPSHPLTLPHIARARFFRALEAVRSRAARSDVQMVQTFFEHYSYRQSRVEKM